MQVDDAGSNLPKIIKRLDLIKNLISLEEESDISLQITKLAEFETDVIVDEIINYLKTKQYGNAIKAIETFINQHHQISFYTDPEIEALRFEAKSLEAQLQQLSDEKAELEKLIHEFDVRHNKELGEIIIKILQFRREQTKGTPKEAETEKDYEDFFANYEVAKEKIVTALSEEEQKELKDKYRKASKLCHPDLVNDDQKEMAHKIFMELNAAYESNDLNRVKEILESLQKGKTFTSKADTVNEKTTLQTELVRLRQRIQIINSEIIEIRSSETFDKIISIENWDDYFSKIKHQLFEQLTQLENERK
jgi:hypothetical protein